MARPTNKASGARASVSLAAAEILAEGAGVVPAAVVVGAAATICGAEIFATDTPVVFKFAAFIAETIAEVMRLGFCATFCSVLWMLARVRVDGAFGGRVIT